MKDSMHKELVQGWKKEVKGLKIELKKRDEIIKQLKELVILTETSAAAGLIPVSIDAEEYKKIIAGVDFIMDTSFGGE